MSPQEFQDIIWQKGHELYREMPWRQDTRPYYVLVSELMLQQTQVDRVIPKFNDFIAAFPDEKSLAQASLADVLVLWQGLGYNRRAKYLHETAKQVVQLGGFPSDTMQLLQLPGIGPNTAGAIMAYAYNQPVVFVETNVRTVYFHHFFDDEMQVDDKQIKELIKQTMPTGEGKEQPERRIHSAPGAMRKTVGLSYGPQAFYWSLMDYGSWLKKQGVGRINKSKHYKKQSPLAGSIREVRGQIIRTLTTTDMTEPILSKQLVADHRFQPALDGLIRDGLIMRSDAGKLHLTK